MAAYSAGRKIYKSARWLRVRRVVLDRDGWRCKKCGRAGALEVHHKVSLDDGGSPFDVDNLEAICRNCHVIEHREIMGESQWRGLLHAIV